MSQCRLELLDCWQGKLGNHSVLAAWRISSLCLMWSIWRERNTRCFEDCEKSVEELKKILVKLLYIWTKAYNISHVSKFSKFVDFCSSFSH
jgi:hypothetical protein